MTKDKGTSVLASLTAQVMQDKVVANRQLTPVEGEGRPRVKVPDVPGDFLTDEGLEMTARDLRKMATDLRRQADGLEKVAAGIDKMRGQDPEAEQPVDLDAARKQKEFEADLRAKERAAQEATFKDDVAEAMVEKPGGDPVPEAPVTEWRCPDHPDATPAEKTSKAGRPFIGCPDCNKFQR